MKAKLERLFIGGIVFCSILDYFFLYLSVSIPLHCYSGCLSSSAPKRERKRKCVVWLLLLYCSVFEKPSAGREPTLIIIISTISEVAARGNIFTFQLKRFHYIFLVCEEKGTLFPFWWTSGKFSAGLNIVRREKGSFNLKFCFLNPF